MAEISNKAIVILLIATIVISLGGTYLSLSALNSRLVTGGMQPLTGFAITELPNGTTSVTVQEVASITFTSATVAFGTGSVNTTGGYANCSLSTIAEWPNSGCVSFTKVNNGFTIENDGNQNLSVEIVSNVTATQFIGSGALFLWNVTLNESGSCLNVSGRDNTVYPNTTGDCASDNPGASTCGAIFEGITTTFKNICPRLRFENGNDALNIDINISIPLNAPSGAKFARITVRGTTA